MSGEKENVNTLAIAWEHKYRALQGKYNAETRDLRQALYRKRLDLEGRLAKSEGMAARLQTSRSRWRKQAGLACFALCVMSVAVLGLWLSLMQTSRKLEKAMGPSCKVEGEMYYADPEVVTAPPSSPVFEL
jgi:anti-sigma-K factor RskA